MSVSMRTRTILTITEIELARIETTDVHVCHTTSTVRRRRRYMFICHKCLLSILSYPTPSISMTYEGILTHRIEYTETDGLA